MNRLNRKVEYALIALKYLAEKSTAQKTAVKEICQATEIPFDATSRVMQQMAQQGILKAEHGAYGGYLLVRDLQQISFLELIETITGPVEIVRCASGQADCEFFTKCNMVSPFKSLNAKLIEFYRSLSLRELIQHPVGPSLQPEMRTEWI